MAKQTIFDKMAPTFEKGGKLEALYPVYEAAATIFYSPNYVTARPSHVRDNIDFKRVMILVWLAVFPAMFFGWYFVGAQEAAHNPELSGGFFSNLLLGAQVQLPIYIVTFAVGGFWEVLFALVRKHEVSEGFFVTSILFSLILPPTIPLWQVALGISFGVVVGKEIFGGTGRNFVNPALTGRAFLYFSYPASMSGDAVWIKNVTADAVTGATPLGEAATHGMKGITENLHVTWWDAFIGNIPGSIGETSTFAILLGAVVIIATGVASWRIIVGVLAGAVATVLLFNAVGSDTNPMFAMPFWWHFVLGGFAFGTVFMATDPVTASVTNTGRYIFGILIGVMTILIRVVNPAFPEGIMLAILFANIFAPIIDYFVMNANIKRRKVRTNVN
ncbi:NADH:ubiquinone reductase (Na(+)-transporting) subunit B [Suttonella ornithocola]|uniref:Na(+)-translocating NADH-quinone reductase subunit B n=1 Tax=Suttonella ornithocola TaxID=279832 RepID=A0A380MPJ1_9GAMM|nr:NADH:ubiquinone reductase (Na(+)-transporting) subunit B [Suttonella ornithocola]SUO94530.1 Na(+)-translocating NADH-quinone reductase subunit B [Suttonella ornithocola]